MPSNRLHSSRNWTANAPANQSTRTSAPVSFAVPQKHAAAVTENSIPSREI